MNRFLTVALALVSVASAVPLAPEQQQTRDGKAVSLFAVVTFPNEQCTSKDDDTTLGTCFSSTECSDKGGTSNGNCAAGFGVCCTFTIDSSSGGTVSQNCTYVQNNGYPSSLTTASATIAYTVNYVQSDICQLRLDFTNFVLPITTGTGACIGTLTVNGPTSRDPPAICGTNTGEHMYVEVGQSSTATTLTIATGTGTTNRSWKIKVNQIACNSIMKAPTDCVQYYTGTAGNFHSYNFDGGLSQQTLEYAICFRREMGFCQINYTVDDGKASPDPFLLVTNPATVNAETEDCTITRLTIPFSTGSGYFCGGQLNVVNDNTDSGTVTQSQGPFQIQVTATTADVSSSTGFFMNWAQIPC
jgi:hypothetical protein